DAIQTGDPVYVDEVRGPRQPEVQERDEGLASCEHLRVLQRTEKPARLLHRRGRVVLERWRLHLPVEHGDGAAQRGLAALEPPREAAEQDLAVEDLVQPAAEVLD